MSQRRIVFDGVWKKFRRGERVDSLRDLVPAAARRLLGRRRSDELSEEEFWAVKNVSFEVEEGRALGIIGANGAGKSTTLKLLTRILRPTRGKCVLNGRVGALIEVAAGFHPDLTGRENIYLQGSIMGMKRGEIARREDEIIDFAGVLPFVDTQVKRYSSGMNARLGFAIAAHLDPDVLIIDEVLSVGDMAFQGKCIQRMKKFKQDGVAIAFVSHSLPAVAELCDDALVLQKGGAAFFGPARDAIEFYLTSSSAGEQSLASGETASLVSCSLLDTPRRRVTAAAPGQRLRMVADVNFAQSATAVSFGIVVLDAATGTRVAAANSASLGMAPRDVSAGERLHLEFPFSANLANGQYLFEFHAATAATMTMHLLVMPAASLRVDEAISPFGLAYLDFGVPELTARGGAERHSEQRERAASGECPTESSLPMPPVGTFGA